MRAPRSLRPARAPPCSAPPRNCGHRRVWYNSCRNCQRPTCQSLARAEWLERRRADLLPTEYFHVVFTVAPAVAKVAAQNKAVVYGLLFRTVADTLRTIAADPRHLGTEIGFFAVLHTWGQTLVHYPHLHCVIPGGSLANDGSGWIACRPGFFTAGPVLPATSRNMHIAPPQSVIQMSPYCAMFGGLNEEGFSRRGTIRRSPGGDPERIPPLDCASSGSACLPIWLLGVVRSL